MPGASRRRARPDRTQFGYDDAAASLAAVSCRFPRPPLMPFLPAAPNQTGQPVTRDNSERELQHAGHLEEDVVGQLVRRRREEPAHRFPRGVGEVERILQSVVVASFEEPDGGDRNQKNDRREHPQPMAAPGDADSVPSEALVQFVGAGLFGLVIWWLDGRTRIGVEEVDTLFRRLAIPAVKAAAGKSRR